MSEDITIEEVRKQYDKWRSMRKSNRDKIPLALWKNTKKLVRNYPVKNIVEGLGLTKISQIKLVHIMDEHIKNGEELHGRKKQRYLPTLKRHVVNMAKNEGLCNHDLSKKFNVPYNTVKVWVNEDKKINNTNKTRSKRRRIDIESIREHIEKYPEYSLNKRSKLLNISMNMLFRKIRELGYVNKGGRYVKGDSNEKIAIKELSDKLINIKPAPGKWIAIDSRKWIAVDSRIMDPKKGDMLDINSFKKPGESVIKDDILNIPEFMRTNIQNEESLLKGSEENTIKTGYYKTENHMFVTKIFFCLVIYALWIFKMPYYQMLSLFSITYCLFSIIEYFILCNGLKEKEIPPIQNNVVPMI